MCHTHIQIGKCYMNTLYSYTPLYTPCIRDILVNSSHYHTFSSIYVGSRLPYVRILCRCKRCIAIWGCTCITTYTNNREMISWQPLFDNFCTTFSLILTWCWYPLSSFFSLHCFWPIRSEKNKVVNKVVIKWMSKYHYSK
jgi:hypothetical protein